MPDDAPDAADRRVAAPPCRRVGLTPRARLILAVLLFALWVGFLAYLALGTADPTVLSRPQFLVATVHVIAQVEGAEQPNPRVQIQEVYWSKADAVQLAGRPLDVANLPACAGWKGAGLYILPLVQRDGVYEVAPLPRSPGFVGTTSSIHPPRIYPLTPDTRAQLESMPRRDEP